MYVLPYRQLGLPSLDLAHSHIYPHLFVLGEKIAYEGR